jgi:uncharacterized protein YndB with AHSA1/START domain
MENYVPEPGTTRTSRVIKASRDVLYEAFLNPQALVQWLPPGNMTGEMYSFDGRVGGGYRMSLFYPVSDTQHRGKTAEREDSVSVRFVELDPPQRIVEAVTFKSDDPSFAGEMTLTVTFDEVDGDTNVTILCTNIPPGIRPEDNDTGTRESLEKLARYVERR